jgi:hypothetical protein
VRLPIALGLTVALLMAVPAEAARDLFVRESPGAAVATCLRPTGAPGLVGLLGPLERRIAPYDLLRVSADGVSTAATARLGVLEVCPAVAADPSGHAIVAGAARVRRFSGVVRAALAQPGGGFGAPVDIARTRSSATEVAAAVGPRGEAVVAWMSVRGTPGRRGTDALTRVIAALRPAGGSFGRPQFLTPWRRGSFVLQGRVIAGMDASGTATVAWTQAIPDRGNIPHLSTIEVAAGPPGERFGPAHVITRSVQDTERVALSVAPDGRALLAHDGQGTIQVFERAPGVPVFSRVRRLRTRRDEWQRPEVAVAADGSALVAWRGADAGSESDGSEDVLLTSRRDTGAWTGPVVLQRRRRGDFSLGESYVILAERIGGRPEPPYDPDNTGLRAAIGPDGRYLVSWGRERRLPLGDRVLAARMVQGEAGGAASRVEIAGCACRSVNGVGPVALAGGEPVLSYTDNVTSMLDFGLEIPRRFGRLHVAESGPAGGGPEPPRLTIRAPRTRTLGYRNRLRVRVGCDRPCDLRAYVVGGRGRARGVAIATLRRAGSTRLAIKPVSADHLAPPSRGRARVVVHGYAPNARRFARRSVAIDLRRKPLRPLPEILNVQAVRRGPTVVVTWQTARPARRVSFRVRGRLSRGDRFPISEESAEGRGKRSFRVRLRIDRELRELGEITVIAVSVVRERPPHDRRTVVVPVSG